MSIEPIKVIADNYSFLFLGFLQFKSQNMIECNFCHSGTQENYIYTECSHLVCLLCASLKWDQKYSIKCCNKTTFLEQETCYTLEKINKEERNPKRDESKENIPIPSIDKTSPTHTPKNIKEDYPAKSRDIQQSIYLSQFDQKPLERQQTFQERKNENCLVQMEEIMNDSVHRIKFTFEMYRKQLEKKEEQLLKDIYNRYSDQLSKYAVTEDDAKEFKQKVGKLIADQLNSFSKFTPKEPQGKPDKILEKLQYNQLKMKEKLNRHYQLLK